MTLDELYEASSAKDSYDLMAWYVDNKKDLGPVVARTIESCYMTSLAAFAVQYNLTKALNEVSEKLDKLSRIGSITVW